MAAPATFLTVNRSASLMNKVSQCHDATKWVGTGVEEKPSRLSKRSSRRSTNIRWMRSMADLLQPPCIPYY
jgi:hypothetical protein